MQRRQGVVGDEMVVESKSGWSTFQVLCFDFDRAPKVSASPAAIVPSAYGNTPSHASSNHDHKLIIRTFSNDLDTDSNSLPKREVSEFKPAFAPRMPNMRQVSLVAAKLQF